ncbi:MAG: M20/M25/M40 family metallo-hydrolase, partial [Acidobacteria bacterium]|nr:M20/M25/M40 family metallo-hydrolase [Acidobacteriota bacterium]
LTARDDRYVARGAADMKGFLALAVNLFAAAEPERLKAPFTLVLTYDEELGCLGAERMFRTWPREDLLPRNTVIGEPTSLKVVRMHKGHMKLRVTLRGVNAHSGYPHLGVNAIEPAGRIITALAALREELEKERSPHSEHFTETPFAALNVAMISGGIAVNVVPDRCRIDVGLRPLPGMEPGTLAQRVEEAVRTAAGAVRFDFEVLNDGPAMMLAEEAPIYRALCRMTGQRETVGVSYGTDAGWLQQMGLDCAVFGPGSIEVAHKPNEFLPRAEFEQARSYLQRLVGESCHA